MVVYYFRLGHSLPPPAAAASKLSRVIASCSDYYSLIISWVVVVRKILHTDWQCRCGASFPTVLSFIN